MPSSDGLQRHDFSQFQSYPCAICGSSNSTPIVTKPGRVVRGPFTIVRCMACRHVFVDPRIIDEEIGRLYDDAYYRGCGFDASVDYSGAVSAWTRAENERIIETVVEARRRPLAGARWLDVGCGTGTLLESVSAAGGIGIGSDDSEAAIAHCRARSIDVASLDSLSDQAGSFDVVSAIEVIEHVTDPVGFVDVLKRFVRPGGIVYVHTENWNVVRRLPGTPYIMPEGHIRYLTPSVMREIFARLELEEADAFDRCWFVWRRLPRRLRALVPAAALRAVRPLLMRMLPEYAPFPVGRK